MFVKKWLLPLVYVTIFVGVLFCIISRDREGESCAIADIAKKETKEKVVIDKSSDLYLKDYIVSVINNGSNRLNHKAGSMASGYADKKDAKDVAEYVMYLMGVERDINKNGRTVYDGNCAGCHGSEGDGINGAFPKLNTKKLEGHLF